MNLSNSMVDEEANISELHSVICPMQTPHIRPEQRDNLSIEMAIDTDPIIFVNNDGHVVSIPSHRFINDSAIPIVEDIWATATLAVSRDGAKHD